MDRNIMAEMSPDWNGPDQNGWYRHGQTKKSCSGIL